MKWEKLTEGKAIKRYKRFMVDCFVNNEVITAHCANSGRMTNCLEENANVLLSYSDSKTRKYPYTLELVKMPESWVCVNTQKANQIASELLHNKSLLEFSSYDSVKAEVTYPQSKSRVDFCLTNNDGEKCFVEVKSCTLVENSVAKFPDAPTTRGQKHLEELMQLKKLGIRSVILFLVLRNDAKTFSPASNIDEKFANNLKNAIRNGVEVLAYHIETTPNEMKLGKKLEIIL